MIFLLRFLVIVRDVKDFYGIFIVVGVMGMFGY